MKVLHLISSGGFFGAENVVVSLAREQSKNMDVCIGIFKDKRNPHIEIAMEAEKRKIKTELFDCSGRIDFRTIRRIRNFIKTGHYNIIHSHVHD